MKNLKKVLSVILTVAMLISSFAAISVSAADYGDVDETNSYYKAIQVLSGLGIVKGDDKGNFNPSSDIKRSEMVTLVCRAKGEESVAQAASGVFFDDVPADHWAASYIAWAVNSDLVKGVGDNKFDPDAPVKFQDAVVMILRALGYERIALRDENGGYPTGYLKVASQKGLLAGASFDGATAATREVVAQVIYNALTTPLVDVSYYAPDPDDDEYVVFDGKNGTDLRTLLTYTNEIYKVKATVENTAKTDESLRKEADAPKVEMDIIGTYDYTWSEILDNQFSKNNNTIKPYVGDTNVSDYLGYTVEAYIVENDDEEWELLAVVVDSKSTDSETVTENFEAYTEGTFEYYQDLNDARTTKIDLADEDDLSIYYNGSLIDDADIDAVTSGRGLEYLLVEIANSITFMGPKNDDYNKIFVTDYAYRQVESVKAEEQFVKFTTGGVSLDKDERGDDTFIYNLYDAEGNAITLEDVQEDDLFNIVAPLFNGRSEEFGDVPYMDIYVTNNVIEGSVTEKIDDDTFYIAGEKYDLDENASIKVGDEGVFYITIDGLVYDSDAASVVNKNYSFIAAYGADESFGVYTHQLKLFTIDNVLETYNVASTLRVYDEAQVPDKDGKLVWEYVAKTYKRNDGTQDIFFADIKDLVDDQTDKDVAVANLANRLVTFKLNTSNEISELRFAGTHVVDFAVAHRPTAKYYDDTKVFASWDLDDNSKLFVTPVTEIATGLYNVDEEDIELASFSSLDEDKVGGYDVYTFSFDKDDYLGAALSAEKITAALKKSHLAVVKTKSTGIDADGSDVDKYTFVQSGETLTKAVDYDEMSNIDAMSIGDVFRYAVDADDEINESEVLYVAATRTFNAGEWTYANYELNDIAVVYGEVTEIKGGKMTLDDGAVLPKMTMNETEGNTYALVDEAKMAGNNPSSAVKALNSAANIKESYSSYTYYVVALIGESNRFEDIVQIQWK